ncbi:MAG: sugar nucleotide-binding protein [Clostridia bacterium]
MKTIAITGATGFFASRFIDYFERNYPDTYRVIPLSRADFDITAQNATMAGLKRCAPDFVLHAAAIADTRLCESNPALSFAVNQQGTTNIALACQAIGAKMIFMSSDQVYIKPGGQGPFTEEDSLLPSNVYAQHKRAAELSILATLPETVVLRLSWLYGPPEEDKKSSTNLLTNALSAIATGTPIAAPTNEYRSVTDVYDLIRQIPALLALHGGVFNAATENNLSTYEYYRTVFQRLDVDDAIIATLLLQDETRAVQPIRDFRMCMNKLKEHKIYI